MSAKHTPGPWKVVKDDFLGIRIKQSDGGDIRSIAEILKHPPGGVLGENNARLIAAAPDLLEALKAVLNNCLDSQSLADAYKQARAAIAKAEGQQ